MSGTTPTPGSEPGSGQDSGQGTSSNPYGQPSENPAPPPLSSEAPPVPPYGVPADQSAGAPPYGAPPEQPAGTPPAWSGPAEEAPQAWSGPSEGTTPEPPKSVLTAVKLMYLGAALSALQVIAFLIFTDRDDFRETVRDAQPDLTESQLDNAVTTGITFVAIVSSLGVLLWVWMAVKNRQGRSWARTVATVLGGLNLVSLVSGLGTGGGGVTMAINVVSIALAATILFFLYRGESSAYFAAVTRARRLGRRR